ncbi:MAG: hypothetical protein KC656_20820, partial [Myxococcales bacterium]|nr:hypothetical protein [Myxococcales bacterium]
MILWMALAMAGEGRWKTVETEHYRVHYPVAAEVWATEAISHLEEARERTMALVGRDDDKIMDVYIQDPFATANGMVLPFAHNPRMVLWATPPDSDSVLSHYRDPFEDLIIHEQLHASHMLEPPRGPIGKLTWHLVGFGPMTTKAPRWITEGYATVVEGQLTGYGRPNADFRAALLRKLAQEGRLPTYGQLNGSSRWMGYSFAYLVGSAYIEWLMERAGEDAFPKVWRRMTARSDKSFDQAFYGVFGDSAYDLYGRFCAEITERAMAVETEHPEAELFMLLDGTTGPPEMSPSGTKMAMTYERWRKPRHQELGVFSTLVDQDIFKRRERRLKRQLEADPLDVAPLPWKTDPHKRIERRWHETKPAEYPRWIDEETLLIDVYYRTPAGRYVTDLVQWDFKRIEKRLTHGANVRRADPSRDGTWAVAVQHDWGATRLVRVTLGTGNVIPLTEYSIETVVDVPRVSPDAKRIVFLEQTTGSGWKPVLYDLKTKERTPIEIPEDLRVSDPEWSSNDTIVFGVGKKGFMEIAELDLRNGRWRTLTDTGGYALRPTVTKDWL